MRLTSQISEFFCLWTFTIRGPRPGGHKPLWGAWFSSMAGCKSKTSSSPWTRLVFASRSVIRGPNMSTVRLSSYLVQDSNRETNINLPITWDPGPPFRSSATRTRFFVFGYCIIVLSNDPAAVSTAPSKINPLRYILLPSPWEPISTFERVYASLNKDI